MALGLWARLLARAYNVQTVDGATYRAAQIYGRHVNVLLAHLSIRTLINLRGPNPRASWYRNARSACDALGVTLVDVTLSSRRLPERATLLDLLAAYDAARPKTLLTCSGGADRTSLAAALCLLHRTGDVAAARRQMRLFPYLHWPKPHQRWIRVFLDFFESDSAGRPIKTWLAEGYAPERFAAFMRGRGQAGYWRE
jgi:protein tyrosine/serine phosphatase